MDQPSHGTDEETVEAPESEWKEGEKVPAEHRTTAPQSPYTMRDVGIGAVVTVVGVLVAFLLPVLLV